MEELEFAIFCIESMAARLNADPTRLYNALAGHVGILYRYIVPEYEVLHTQDKEYIVDDILDVMQEEGVSDFHCMSDEYLAEDLEADTVP